jgi:hypothetical protein
MGYIEMNLTYGCIYYTDLRAKEFILNKCMDTIKENCPYPIVSVSLNEPVDLGANICIKDKERGYPTMVLQIITALERLNTDVVFFLENDVLYHKSHFNFTPDRDDIYYYNANNWRWRYDNTIAITYDHLVSLSQLCCNRELALKHFRYRQQLITKRGLDKIVSRDPKWVRVFGYEPGTKRKRRGGVTDEEHTTWRSEFPNIDIRHNRSASQPKTTLDSFKHAPSGWKEKDIDEVEGWALREVFDLWNFQS